MRFEILTSGISFLATSLYWLIAAFRMSAAEYGHMMQLQATILIVTAIFSLRTHDLVFYLQKSHSWGLTHSFNFSQRIEFSLVITGTICAFVLLLVYSAFMNSAGLNIEFFAWSAIALLANSTLIQGSSLAYLRIKHLDRKIAWSELYGIGSWSVALVLVLIWQEPRPQEVLAVGFAASAIKPIVLAIIARCSLEEGTLVPHTSIDILRKKDIVFFLIGGQLTNMLKNTMVSVETIVAGLMMHPEAVATFRVSRSFFGLTTALLNITYQKTFRAIVGHKPSLEIKPLIKKFNKQSLTIWAISIPATIVASFLFLQIKDDIAYQGLPLITIMVAIAFLPIALQQSYYALLTLEVRFEKISAAYIIGGAVLLIVCFILKSNMTLPLFIASLCAANFSRLWFMRYASKAIFK